MSAVISYEVKQNVAVITVNNPPVNALSHAVRQGLQDAVDRLNDDDNASAAILVCSGKTFIAGADISEFNKPPMEPLLPAVIAKIESSAKIIVAAIHGTALGGGFETAMACHYRCAVASARAGLPEVNLGLLPGATGTQRLPRLVGVKKALDMIISGKPVAAGEAYDDGAIDRIVEGDLLEGAMAYCRELIHDNAPPRRLSETAVDKAGLADNFFKDYLQQIEKKYRGYFSPQRIVQCVEASVLRPYQEAVRLERKLFEECKASTHSRALRHLFFAEREVTKIPDVPADVPVHDIRKAAVIGAGTMGSGIAMNFINAGIPVYLLERNEEAMEKGIELIRNHYEGAIKKGRITAAQRDENMALVSGTVEYGHVHDADLVIEAVFEDMAVKQEVFRTLDKACKAGAILATNTSTLDVNEIAAVTRRPESVLGLHFFAPANVMTLLEIVRGQKTSKQVVATAMALAKTIKKTGVLVGVCFGFVGNRMFLPYVREAQLMVLEGVSPERIDKIAWDWGMAMGPFAVMDMSGLDVFYRINQAWTDRPDDPAYFRLCNVLHEIGHSGQKSGAGFYKYKGHEPLPDSEVMKIAAREADDLGIMQRDISDEEVIERLFYPMINEGARVLQERIALRPGDIDVIFVHGYGMPRYRGGPMCYANTLGPGRVHEAICRYKERYGGLYWTPAPLLEQLAKQGKDF